MILSARADVSSVLHEDTGIEMVRLPATLPRMLTGRWALRSGRKLHTNRWKDAQVRTWQTEQRERPVCIRAEVRRSLWWFRDRFYWDEDGHSAANVEALLLERVGRGQRPDALAA